MFKLLSVFLTYIFRIFEYYIFWIILKQLYNYKQWLKLINEKEYQSFKYQSWGDSRGSRGNQSQRNKQGRDQKRPRKIPNQHGEVGLPEISKLLTLYGCNV